MTNPYEQPLFELYWEDFVIGHESQYGSKTVTTEEIIEFASKFDPQRFHMNEEQAQKTIFKGIIASGWHTCSMMMKMMCDEYIVRSSSIGSPGLENITWHKPVRPGDTLRVKSKILDKRTMDSKPTIGLVQNLWECLNQNDQVVASMTGWTMFLKRPNTLEGKKA